MNPMPEGWSVGVDGQNVVMRFPDEDDSVRRVLNRHQAQVLREQLQFAYMLAERNELSAGGTGEVPAGSALMRDRLYLRREDMTAEETAEWARLSALVQPYVDYDAPVPPADTPPTPPVPGRPPPPPIIWETGQGQSLADTQPGYEIRDKRDSEEGRPSIEAWLPGWYWPVVQAIEHERVWLVLADLKVAELAGVRSAFPAAETINADRALEWVRLITGLYVKALKRQTPSRADRWPVDVTGSDGEGWSITIPGAPVAATGSTLVEAVGGVVRELREYAADWAARQRIGPVHVKNWWLVQLVTHASDDQLADWIRSSAPALTWVPRAEFLAQWRSAQADSGRGDGVAGRETTDDDAIADASSDEREEQ